VSVGDRELAGMERADAVDRADIQPTDREAHRARSPVLPSTHRPHGL